MRWPRNLSYLILTLGLSADCPAPAAEVEPAHAQNDIYQFLLDGGLAIARTPVAFPPPLLRDGDSIDAERAALRKLAGSDEDLKELLRNSVTAPQIVRVHDEKAAEGTMIRIADVWFAVHADLEAIDPARLGGARSDTEPVEAGNMRFQTHLLGDEELKERGIVRKDPKLEWYTHVTGVLLDRIHIDATSRALATRAKGSWVFASRTDPRFDGDKPFPNRWWMTQPGAAPKSKGTEPRRYEAGASYTKVSRLASAPGTLLVEGHLAFEEPRAWFDGAPILRSKISLVAQDQIRRLRRELAKPTARP
jgi:hypothetical protein